MLYHRLGLSLAKLQRGLIRRRSSAQYAVVPLELLEDRFLLSGNPSGGIVGVSTKPDSSAPRSSIIGLTRLARYRLGSNGLLRRTARRRPGMQTPMRCTSRGVGLDDRWWIARRRHAGHGALRRGRVGRRFCEMDLDDDIVAASDSLFRRIGSECFGFTPVASAPRRSSRRDFQSSRGAFPAPRTSVCSLWILSP